MVTASVGKKRRASGMRSMDSLETKRHNVMWSHKCLPQRVLDLALPSREWAPKWEVQEVRQVREHRMQQQRRQR